MTVHHGERLESPHTWSFWVMSLRPGEASVRSALGWASIFKNKPQSHSHDVSLSCAAAVSLSQFAVPASACTCFSLKGSHHPYPDSSESCFLTPWNAPHHSVKGQDPKQMPSLTGRGKHVQIELGNVWGPATKPRLVPLDLGHHASKSPVYKRGQKPDKFGLQSFCSKEWGGTVFVYIAFCIRGKRLP